MKRSETSDHSGKWRLLRDGDGAAAWNMALDEALLSSVVSNVAPPTMRLYSWDRSSVSIGRFQHPKKTLHVQACEALNVPIVRRITGGRGILHGDDLTVSIAAPLAALGLPADARSNVASIYRRIASGFLAAFARLGVEAGMGACVRRRGQDLRGNCFDIISQADIVDTEMNAKLLGAALHLREGFVLQQVSIPLRTASKVTEQRRLARSIFCGQDVSDGGFRREFESAEAVAAALVQGVSEALGVRFEAGSILHFEADLAGHMERQRYLDDAWTYKGVGADL